MPMTRRPALIALSLCLALLTAACGGGSADARTGQPAPAITGTALDGTAIDLAKYRGHPLVVNFWASWCVPCREEAPVLESFQRRHGDGGFTVLGIDSRDLSGDGRAFVRRFGLSYPQLRDGDGATAHDFGTTGVPENYLVDPRGKVRALVRGPVDEEYLDSEVAPLLPGESS